MATIRMVSWNIEIYGPKKYGLSVNGVALVNFIARYIARQNPNLVVTMELMSSVGDQIGFNLAEALGYATGAPWGHATVVARPQGDREAYGVYWRTDAAVNFQPAVVAGNPVWGLAALDYPNNFSTTHGRRAAYMTFQTTDTGQFFTVTVYHAPPNNFAVAGLQPLALMPQLYNLGGAPAGPVVNGRLLAGDYNLDVTVPGQFSWLVDPLPQPPPPAAAGQGAGCTPAVTTDTLLLTLQQAQQRWGQNINHWGVTSTAYRQPLAVDNIFYAPAAGGGGSAVLDVVNDVATVPAVQGWVAQFQLFDAAGNPAFPNAQFMGATTPMTLANMPYAWLFTRFAVSDHLPVLHVLTV